MTRSTREFWESLPYRFKRGAVMGPSELATYASMTPPSAHAHLQRLHAAGMVRRIPCGTKRVRHLYAGIPTKN